MSTDPEGNLVLIPDHADIMLARLPLQFRQQPRFEALIRSIGLGIQCVEADAFGMLVSTTLEASTGDALDQWGELVGERRGGLDDDDYRVFIEARILANKSNGSPDEIIEIWRRITAPQISVRYTLHPLACFTLSVLRAEPMNDERAARVGAFMRIIKPGGVAMDLVEAITGYFGFLDDPGHPGVEADDGASFGFDEGMYSRLL